MTKPSSPANHPSIFNIVASAMSFRLIIDTSVQFVYPYLPIFAAGLGVSIIEIGWLVSIRSMMGLFTPLFGWLAEAYGYRTLMRWGMWLAGAGLLTFALSMGLPTAALGMALMGLGIAAFVPTLFAWASALLPFEQRAKGLGALELSWALAGMFCVSLVGFCIARFGWRPPLVVLSLLLFTAGLLINRLPGRADKPENETEQSDDPLLQQVLAYFDLGINRCSAWAVVIGSGLISFANFHTFSVYAQWVVDRYAVSEVGLASVAFVMGSAELLSNLGISFFGDRIGPLRGTKIAITGAAIFFTALYGLQGGGYGLFLAGLFVARYFMENAYVNNIILASEQTPDYRAKALTLMSAASTIGLSIANWSGPYAYTQVGPIGLIAFSVAAFVAAWLILQLFAKEKGESAFEPAPA